MEYKSRDNEGVFAKRDIGEKVKKGMLGIIVMDYMTNNDYEVEFLDENHDTVAVITVNAKDLILDTKYQED